MNDLYELKIGELEWIQIKYHCFDHLGNVNRISPRGEISFFELENRLHLFGGRGENGIVLNDYNGEVADGLVRTKGKEEADRKKFDEEYLKR